MTIHLMYYDIHMSERLKQIMKHYVIKNGGPTAKAKLSLASGKSLQMIDRYLKGLAAPGQDTRYRLALACGCTEQEALALACESLPGKTERTA